MCEPICHVDTLVEAEETLHSWWPNETEIHRPVTKPQYSLNSTSRADYKNFSQYTPCPAYTRLEALQHNSPDPHAAMGIVPGYRISEYAPRVSEKISYEHQLNSRRDPGHPIRGKRHGSFVWKVVSPARKMQHYKNPKMNSNERKDVLYKLANVETYDEDAKSLVSTISTKHKELKEKELDPSDEFEHFEPQVKNDTWILPASINHHLSTVAKQPGKLAPLDDLYDTAESEMKEIMIKPSHPRRHSQPPHVI